ncbi:ABC transporter substrate-binding protein [Zhengella mangrovi]|uniref:ABC transporter substrate-binding protein n=1 Tax=Zhengella mangrovi TaxID=1982044 RepID=A0A2G1QMN9_9HYPH|nr:ABC transporter substrate-binding protein [Zhengella mangrovi]PHP66729.1 ABC transporter substrate-binding protein [Zhengella mangrovi]
MKRRTVLGLTASALMLGVAFAPAQAADTMKIGMVVELSGGGAPAGTNFRDGALLAAKEINASGGVMGQQLEISEYDTGTDPQTSRALVQKAIDEGAYNIWGTVYSSSTIVNMMVAQQAGVPQITGSEAPNITAQGNPYIFRTSYGAQKGIPALTAYFKDTLGAKKVAVAWVNNEFGKGGHDVFVGEMKKAGIDVVADIPSEAGAADFAADVARIKDSGADAVFVYLHEEESARFLREASKQAVQAKLVGEVTLTGQKVIDLAGDAANGAVAHVGLTADAPLETFKTFKAAFEKEYNRAPDHNALKGYIGAYITKYGTEKAGAVDQEKFANTMHGLCLKAAEYPGILMDTCWDDSGEMSRPSFMIEVKDGKQVVGETVPAN